MRIDIPSILVHLRAAQWCQETWDVNDSVLIADPKTDAEVGEFFSRLPDGDYLPTWHTQRQPGSAVDAHEQAAATKAAAHADTTNRAYFYILGRPFLTVAHNKVVRPDHPLHDTQATFHTRVELDIQGTTSVNCATPTNRPATRSAALSCATP